MVNCHYFFLQGAGSADCFQDSFYCSSFILPESPTLAHVRQKFPYQGQYYFRAKYQLRPEEFVWIDLVQESQYIPIDSNGKIYLKVLQLSDQGHEGPIKAYEPIQLRDHMPKPISQQRTEDSFHPPDASRLFSTAKSSVQKLHKQSLKVLKSYFPGDKTKRTSNFDAIDANLSELYEMQATPFLVSNPSHGRMIKDLYELYNTRFFQRKHDMHQFFRAVGIQDLDDSAHELESVLIVQNLLHIGQIHPKTVSKVLHESEYTFLRVAKQLTNMLMNIVRHFHHQSIEAVVLFEDRNAFSEVYSIMVEAFDRAYHNSNPKDPHETKLERSFYRTEQLAARLLEANPLTVEQLVHLAYDQL